MVSTAYGEDSDNAVRISSMRGRGEGAFEFLLLNKNNRVMK